MRRAALRIRPLAGECALLVAAALVLAFAAVAGLVAGLLLFAALARTLRVPRPPRALAAATPFVLLRAAAEEALWRWGLLLGLLPQVGAAGAAAVSSAAFATAHGTHQGPRAFAVRAATGAVFALVFVGTGRLAAAILAHGVYNTLALAAAAWEREA